MSTNTRRALDVIKHNKEKKIKGGYNCIPFGLKRTQQNNPGVQKSNFVILTANSGVGKSKFVKSMYVFRPYDFVISHPHIGIKFTTLYFCLEEPKEAFMQSLMCYRLYREDGTRVSIKELRSQLNPEDPMAYINDELEKRLDDMVPYLEEFEKSVILIDDVKSPYGIYRTVLDFLEENGDYTLKPVKRRNKTTGEIETIMKKDRYIPNHPDHYVQIIIDHVSLLHPEKGQDLFEAIRILSNNYLVNLRNMYGCSIVMVQQQASDKEKQQYTFKGASIEAKLEPSLDGLGDCKLTQRDADEIYGIFAPNRYGIIDHRGYDIGKLRDSYRSFSYLKTRDGTPNLLGGFYFDGATNYIAELPPAKEMTDEHYEKVYKLTGRA